MCKIEEVDLVPGVVVKHYEVISLVIDGIDYYGDSFDELDTPRYSKHLYGIQNLFDAIASSEIGPQIYKGKNNICHPIIKGKIWQFRKGNIRVLWFYSKNKVVVCTHCFAKKTDKTPAKEKKLAIEIYGKYMEKFDE